MSAKLTDEGRQDASGCGPTSLPGSALPLTRPCRPPLYLDNALIFRWKRPSHRAIGTRIQSLSLMVRRPGTVRLKSRGRGFNTFLSAPSCFETRLSGAPQHEGTFTRLPWRRRCRPSTLRLQTWESLGPSLLSRPTEQSLGFNRTNKAGFRDDDNLWSRCFKRLARRSDPSAAPHARFANDAAGIAALAAFCRKHGAELAVTEATGGYERSPDLLFCEEGAPSALVNPRGVRDFGARRRQSIQEITR